MVILYLLQFFASIESLQIAVHIVERVHVHIIHVGKDGARKVIRLCSLGTHFMFAKNAYTFYSRNPVVDKCLEYTHYNS